MSNLVNVSHKWWIPFTNGGGEGNYYNLKLYKFIGGMVNTRDVVKFRVCGGLWMVPISDTVGNQHNLRCR